MNFEKALEAMRQGKKVHRKAWRDTEIYLSSTTLFTMICDDVFADDWEIYEEPKQRKPEMTAEKAKKTLRLVRAEALCRGMVFEHCSLEEFVAAIDFALEILKKQAEKEKKVSQLAENAQKKQEAANKCGFNCKIQPAKWFSDDIQKLAFGDFAAGLKCGLNIAKDLQKENKNNAG